MAAKHHTDLVFCRKQPGIAIGRLCEKCDGRCVICDSYVRPHALVHICDECNYGSFEGRCIVCSAPGVSDAYYCRECTLQEKDRDGCPKIINLGSARTDLFYEKKKYGFKTSIMAAIKNRSNVKEATQTISMLTKPEKGSKLNETIEAALRRLFSNQAYLPLDPFKLVIFTLRRKETKQAVYPSKTQFPKLTTRSVVSKDIPLVKYGTADAFGLKHLAKLMSTIAIRRVWALLTALKEALGKLPTSVVTGNSKSMFIETVAASNCFSSSSAIARAHALESVVESIIEAKSLDQALIVFIRRVVDEAFAAEKSKHIASAQIKVILSGRDSRMLCFRVKEIDSKRQQVMSVLKAAVVDSGEIFLELFLKVERVLPGMTEEANNWAESSIGFVKIIRKYHFSFKDTSSSDNQCRCFSKHPFETLARNIFFDGYDATMYRSVYATHCSRMRQANEDAREVLMDNVIISMAKEAAGMFEKGELVNAAEFLLQLSALLNPHEMTSTSEMRSISLLLTGTVGYFHAVKENLMGLEALVSTISDAIEQDAQLIELYYSTNGGSLYDPEIDCKEMDQSMEPELYFSPASGITTEDDRNTIRTIHSLYGSIPSALKECRTVILNLLRDGVDSACELYYLREHISRHLYSLFDPLDLINPIITENPFDLSKKMGLLGVQRQLDRVIDTLHHMSCYLNMLETSMASDILYEIFEMESEINIMRSLPMNKSDQGGMFVSSKTKKKLADAPQVIPINMVPLNFIELLGYVYAIRNQTLLSSKMVWQKYNIDPLLKPYVAPYADKIYRKISPGACRASISYKAEEQGLIISNVTNADSDENSVNASYPWDVMLQLNVNSNSRFGCVDIQTALKDEISRYDMPKFMVKDGIRIRYLMETHLFRALQEGLLDSQLRLRYLSEYSHLCTFLFRFSSNLQLWRVCDEVLSHNIYAAHQLSLVHVTTSGNASRVSRMMIPGVNTPKDISEYKKQMLLQTTASQYLPLLFPSTGIYGTASVLYGLGGFLLPNGYTHSKDADASGTIHGHTSMSAKIFTHLWSIPAFVPGVPFSPPGYRMSVHSGLAIETAIKWGWQWNCSESRFMPPTRDGVKRAGSGGNGPQGSNATASVAQSDNDSDDEFNLEMDETEDENGVSKRKKKEGSSWFRSKPPPKIKEDQGPRPPGSYFTSPYNDVGVLDYPGEIILENVYKCVYDHPDSREKVRNMFAVEVHKCCVQLGKRPLWSVLDMSIHAGSGEHEKKFSISSIQNDAHMANAMMKYLAKYGSGTLTAAVALSDLVTEEVLMDEEFPRKNTVAGKDSKFSDNHPKQPLRLVTMEKILGVLNRLSIERQAQNADNIDPSSNDIERIVFDSPGNSRILSSTSIKAGAPLPSPVSGSEPSKPVIPVVRCYVPVKIRFSLLGVCMRSLRARGKKKKKSRSRKNSVGMLTIGDATVCYARLIASTLWFSGEASSSIWDCLRNVGTDGIGSKEDKTASEADADICFNIEAMRHWKLFKSYCDSFDFVAAYEHAAAYCLISNQPQYAGTLCRMLNSLPAQLRKCIQCIDMCMEILGRGTSVSSSVNIGMLGHTLVRHVCLSLRLCITSPRSVHLNGGCYIVLRKLEQLEKILNLGRIPLHRAGYLVMPPVATKAPPLTDTEDIQSQVEPVPEYETGLPEELPLPVEVEEAQKSLDSASEKLRMETGESLLRKQLDIPGNIIDAVYVLTDIRGYAVVLLEALSKDVHLTCAKQIESLVDSTSPVTIQHTPAIKKESLVAPKAEESLLSKLHNGQALDDELGLPLSDGFYRKSQHVEVQHSHVVQNNVQRVLGENANSLSEGGGVRKHGFDPFSSIVKLSQLGQKIKNGGVDVVSATLSDDVEEAPPKDQGKIEDSGNSIRRDSDGSVQSTVSGSGTDRSTASGSNDNMESYPNSDNEGEESDNDDVGGISFRRKFGRIAKNAQNGITSNMGATNDMEDDHSVGSHISDITTSDAGDEISPRSKGALRLSSITGKLRAVKHIKGPPANVNSIYEGDENEDDESDCGIGKEIRGVAWLRAQRAALANGTEEDLEEFLMGGVENGTLNNSTTEKRSVEGSNVDVECGGCFRVDKELLRKRGNGGVSMLDALRFHQKYSGSALDKDYASLTDSNSVQFFDDAPTTALVHASNNSNLNGALDHIRELTWAQRNNADISHNDGIDNKGSGESTAYAGGRGNKNRSVLKDKDDSVDVLDQLRGFER